MKIGIFSCCVLTVGLAFCDYNPFALIGGTDSEAAYQRAVSRGAKTQIILRVVDDGGCPVSAAEVKVIFAMGADFHADYFKTDKDGVAVVEGVTTGNLIQFSIRKAGYYGSTLRLRFLRLGENRKVEGDKWLPWGEKRSMTLRKIHNPVLRDGQLKFLRAPTTNIWMGLDLKLADWVKPFGNGVIPDVEFNVQWDGLPPDESKLCRYDMRVCGSWNGYYLVDKIVESEFSEAYAADLKRTFATTCLCYEYCRGTLAVPQEDFWNSREAIFRVRTITDKNGHIQSANYASIRKCVISPGTRGRGALIEFRRVFNPTPNDTNLEPKR